MPFGTPGASPFGDLGIGEADFQDALKDILKDEDNAGDAMQGI